MFIELFVFSSLNWKIFLVQFDMATYVFNCITGKWNLDLVLSKFQCNSFILKSVLASCAFQKPAKCWNIV